MGELGKGEQNHCCWEACGREMRDSAQVKSMEKDRESCTQACKGQREVLMEECQISLQKDKQKNTSTKEPHPQG